MPKLGLCVFPFIDDPDLAFQEMMEYIDVAGRANCDLIAFPEASFGGMDISGVYEQDIVKCLWSGSPQISALQQAARSYRMGIGLGYLEHDGKCIYDSYLLLDPDGGIALNYRRISPGWLPLNADRNRYGCGAETAQAFTEWGSIGILSCGDLFEESVAFALSSRKPDLILHAMARAFPLSGNIQQEWDGLEFPQYMAEYAKLGAPVAMVNLLDNRIEDGCVYCGGAWLVRDGSIACAKELLSPGLLFVSLP